MFVEDLTGGRHYYFKLLNSNNKIAIPYWLDNAYWLPMATEELYQGHLSRSYPWARSMVLN